MNPRRLNLYASAEVAVGLLSIGVGLLLSLGPATWVFGAYEATVAQAFFAADQLPAGARALNHWLLATCGAGVVGWGVAWAAIAHFALRRAQPWAWWCLAGSLVLWVGLDLAIALWFGVFGEVVFVLAALVLAAIPLVLARPYMR